MTVKELAENSQSPVKVISGTDGRVLCHRFDPTCERHSGIGDLKIVDLWADIVLGEYGFGKSAYPIIACYVRRS